MGGIKAQYDSVAGKAIYNAVAGKQQVISNSIPAVCTDFCSGTQPSFIDVTFVDLVDCTACFSSFATFFKVTVAVASNINGNTYRLTKDAGNDCLYTYIELSADPLAPFGAVGEYGGSSCVAPIIIQGMDELYIELEFISSTTFSLTCYVRDSAPVANFRVFHRTPLSKPDDDCFSIEDTYNNYSSCGTEGGFTTACEDGTATITL